MQYENFLNASKAANLLEGYQLEGNLLKTNFNKDLTCRNLNFHNLISQKSICTEKFHLDAA